MVGVNGIKSGEREEKRERKITPTPYFNVAQNMLTEYYSFHSEHSLAIRRKKCTSIISIMSIPYQNIEIINAIPVDKKYPHGTNVDQTK